MTAWYEFCMRAEMQQHSPHLAPNTTQHPLFWKYVRLAQRPLVLGEGQTLFQHSSVELYPREPQFDKGVCAKGLPNLPSICYDSAGLPISLAAILARSSQPRSPLP